MDRNVLKLKLRASNEGNSDENKTEDFYRMIIGVRSWSHSLKGMKLKLRAIRERMRCVVFRFPFKDIFFLHLKES